MKRLQVSKMKRLLCVVLTTFLCFSLTIRAYAIDGVWHDPDGMDDLYEIQPTERYPRCPTAGETVYIKGTTWPIEMGQTVWVTYSVNGVTQQPVGASWKYNDGNNSYWEAAIGPFAKGDFVSYIVHADQNGQNEKSVGPFSFHVTAWEKVASVSLASQSGGVVVLNATPNTGSFSPKLGLSFPTASTLHFQLSPKGNVSFESGISDYLVTDSNNEIVITTSALRVTITKSPYAIEIYDIEAGKILTDNGSTGLEMSWLTDGNQMISGVKEAYESPASEYFYGFGEHYNTIQQRGNIVHTYVYNQYQNQGEKTYLSIPFFYSSAGYGIYLNTNCYSQFDMASTVSTQYSFFAETNGSASSILDYYLIAGTPEAVLGEYAQLSGRPQTMPKWAFGLWMSANEWDRQSEVIGAIQNANTYNIPATVVVLEQWSDENTFYIFNDSTYVAKPGSNSFQYSDFTFGTKWPDPQDMADTIHDNGIKLILWQVPVLKHTEYTWTQKDNDEAYMIAQGYAVGNGSGGQYRTPTGTWFGDSLLLDFTNQNAVDWWMSKRAYLFDDVGIDGFKTDGGEMVWGHDVSFSDGSTGAEMRNAYPNTYIKAYNDFSAEKTGIGMTFSRAGTSGVQSYGAFWAGDQTSSFSAFKDAVRAGISAGLSGVPFWGWDLAGFTGNYPSAELYKRSTMMAAFSPIMQFHSEKSNPSISEERSPWNAQARTSDPSIIPHFRYYVNTRMNLLPYIYSEATRSTVDGSPMMRAMLIDFPEDENTYSLDEQYMFGRSLLVAPVLNEGQTVKDVYLPDGEWIDFFHNALTAGGAVKSYYCSLDSIPVYVRNGSILPLNLNENYEIGGNIGNDIDNYTNLTFRVYPDGNSSYTLFHSDGCAMTVTAEEDFENETVSVALPAFDDKITVQVFGSKPTSVSVNNVVISEVASVSALAQTTQGYYYSSAEKLTYVKLPAFVSSRAIVLNGIHRAPYEAEHAELWNVSTNTDHTGFFGDGFVDGFSEVGDSVTFTVYSDVSRTVSLDLRYSAGTEAGQRSVSVNNGNAVAVMLPKTVDWNTWNTVTIPISLVAGRNTICVHYAGTDYAGINLDCVFVRID